MTAHIVSDLVDDLIEESSEDVVGLWEITAVLAGQLPQADDAELRRLGGDVVRGLVDAGLLIGDLVSGRGFVPRDDPRDVDPVLAEWDALGHLPNMGDDVCWFGEAGSMSDRVVSDLVDELFDESADDIIGLWEITWTLTGQLPGADDAEVRRLGELTVRGLVDAGLLIGDLVSGRGFVPWDDPFDVERVLAAWDGLDHPPNMGDDICYFARPGT